MVDGFNLYKVFIGDTTLLQIVEIIFRTSFMYIYTILNIRLMDKRSLGMLSPFELIIVIALGTSVGDPMFYTHVPLIQGMFVISSIVLLERIISFFAEKNTCIEKIVGGSATLIIKNGTPLVEVLKQQSYSRQELYSALRIKGIRNIGQVEYGYLEPSGEISVLLYNSPQKGESTLEN